MKNKLFRKGLGLSVALLLVFLIFTVLIQSVSAVRVFAGTPNDTMVYCGDTIVFEDVELTIRGAEAIPVNQLAFVIYNSTTNHKIAKVHFSIFGVMISENPKHAFTVVNITDTSYLPYQSGGSYYGYDERTGHNVTGFENGYGYGYGYGYGASDLTIIYKIIYKACRPGTYYAKLFVKTSEYNYVSGKSIIFTVLPNPKLSVYVDIMPGVWPNNINTKSHGYISVAICGTSSFDVRTIDSKSLMLSLENGKNFVKTPAWRYEDVATPWKGSDGGGHALGGDGYMDLVMKFRVEQVIHVLKLFKKSSVPVKIILSGCLKKTMCCSTSIIGDDFVVMHNSGKK